MSWILSVIRCIYALKHVYKAYASRQIYDK
jgi:hypothetical protein